MRDSILNESASCVTQSKLSSSIGLSIKGAKIISEEPNSEIVNAF